MKTTFAALMVFLLVLQQESRADIEVFLALGGRTPNVQEGQVVSTGTRIRTGADGLVVLEESWSPTKEFEPGTCTAWTIISGGASKKVESLRSARCRAKDDFDESISRAMSLQKTVSTTVVFMSGAGKADGATNVEDYRDRVKKLSAVSNQAQLGNGVYTIQQKSTKRFVDAHETGSRDYRLVTRTAQNNDTQRWILKRTGPNTYTMRQKSNMRFVDAHEYQGKNYGLVTRTAQNNDTQRWIFRRVGPDTYTIQQKSNGRYVDAHVTSNRDFSVVTRTAQNNDTQRWIVKPK